MTLIDKSNPLLGGGTYTGPTWRDANGISSPKVKEILTSGSIGGVSLRECLTFMLQSMWLFSRIKLQTPVWRCSGYPDERTYDKTGA